MEEQYAIEIEHVSKSFGGIKALDDITMRIKQREFHSIIGENGAGKSTLMKILSGAYKKDTGSIKIYGQKNDLGDPHISRELGIGIIYQEFSLAPDLSVAENIFLGSLTGDNKTLLVNFRELRRKAQEILERLGFDISPKKLVKTLPVAHQQIVEIAKALSHEVKILILDEPTSVLTDPEIERLFDILFTLKEHGVTILYISHRLEEVFKLSDRITVLKDGQFIVTKNVDEIDKFSAIHYMTGRDLSSLFPPKKPKKIGKELLRVENLFCDNGIHDINMTLRRGEIVGLSGLVGAGRTEFAHALFGIDKVKAGTIYVKGKKTVIQNISAAKNNRIGLVPEDRKKQGLVLPMSVAENMTMAHISDVLKYKILLNRKREKLITGKFVKSLSIKTAGYTLPASSLSGGNQQKIVIGKWLNTKSEILILDEPTRGVDVGAKFEIYQLIHSLASEGYGIMFISSELPEIIGVSDRVLVFSEGTITGELSGSDMTEPKIMELSIPIGRKKKEIQL